jgi:hypothetical protein
MAGESGGILLLSEVASLRSGVDQILGDGFLI